jgi:hypothetical protein
VAKSKKTPENVKRILTNLASGCTRKSASLAAGISEETFYQYMKDPEFSELVLKAEESFVVRNCALIQKAAPKEWRAAAWLLERRRPDDFKLRQELDVNKLTDEQILRLLERTTEAGGDSAGSDPRATGREA